MAAKAISNKIPTVVPTDAELEELGKSLTAKEIPAKLRCGICDLIAYNTIRLPCCSTNICENCFKTELPDDSDECILCHHTPLDKSICTANKSMRTTIRALLKNKFETRLKRQNAEAAKAAKEAELVRPSEIEESTNGKPSQDEEHKDVPNGDGADGAGEQPGAKAMEVSASAPSHDSAGLNGHVETSELPTDLANTGVSTNDSRKEEHEDRPATADSDSVRVAASQQNGQWASGNSMDRNQMNGASGMNGMNNMNGMFPMDFNSMMPTGMMPMAGLPNMMGMGMMPSMMSQMFGGFDGSNMGMNMNAMGAGAGFNNQNQYGGSWMAGQDTYNNNAYGNGGYGNQGGYNVSGNYNSMNDQSYANNDSHRGYGRQGFQNRRGRRGYYNGGYGRNNYNQMHQGNQYGYANQNGSTQQAYSSHHGGEKFSHVNGGSFSTGEQAAQGGATAEEAEAQMMKDLAPGGQHDFDEELGRRPSVDETMKSSPENAENAETSISSNFKGTIPIEATTEEATEANDHVDMAVADGEQTSDEKADFHEQPSLAAESAAATAATPDVTANDKEDFVESRGIEGDDGVADPTPQPIQTFISDEPRSRNAMPPPAPSMSVGPTLQGARGLGRPGGHMPSIASQIVEISPIESNGIGVVGAPTGPRALRQGLPNTGRSGWNPSSASNPAASESTRSDGRGRSRSRSPHRHPSVSNSRSRSRSPVHRFSDHRSRRPHSPNESNDPMLDRYDERREDRREDKREERRHRHSQRNYGEDEVDGTDTRHSSHRSHRRYDKDAEKSDHRRHRHHHHSRSQSPDRDRDRERHRDRDRTSEKEKFHYREDDRDEERRRRRRESRSLGNSAAPTPTTPFAPEFTNGYEEHSSRKRRNRDYDEDREQERYEKKRSRRESSPAYDNKSDRHEHNYENSKPPTPITPNFGGHSPVSRRGSIATNGVSQVKAPILSKPIPTGPRASLQQNRKAERFEEPEQQAPAAPAKKPEKDVHTLEREARDRERLQREMQRRAFGSSKRRTSGTATQPSRRVSYKYEDEDGLDARRVEHEREAGRWS